MDNQCVSFHLIPQLPQHRAESVVDMRKRNIKNSLPVRADVREVQYHRPPTAGEIEFGYGATHYRIFPLEECVRNGTRVLKKWFVADDGLRYYH